MPFGTGHRRVLANRAQAESGATKSEAGSVRTAVNEMSAIEMVEARFRYNAWARA